MTDVLLSFKAIDAISVPRKLKKKLHFYFVYKCVVGLLFAIKKMLKCL